jgi:anti-anti-sigma regulatory factor
MNAFAARDFKKQVDLIWSKDVKQVELDFKQVGFIDSSGVVG